MTETLKEEYMEIKLQEINEEKIINSLIEEVLEIKKEEKNEEEEKILVKFKEEVVGEIQ